MLPSNRWWVLFPALPCFFWNETDSCLFVCFSLPWCSLWACRGVRLRLRCWKSFIRRKLKMGQFPFSFTLTRRLILICCGKNAERRMVESKRSLWVSRGNLTWPWGRCCCTASRGLSTLKFARKRARRPRCQRSTAQSIFFACSVSPWSNLFSFFILF